MSTNSLILYSYPRASTKKIASEIGVLDNNFASALDNNSGSSIPLEEIKINRQLRVNIITQYKENHILGSCLIGDIINFRWVRWKYNRPSDMVRVEEIIEYIEKGNSIDWLLYFIYSDNSDKMACLSIYDGLHRMTAISEYIRQFEKQQGIRCQLRDFTILISIRINPTDGEIVDAFQFINKSVAVPDLYFTEHIKKDIIEEIVDKWQRRYKRHFRSTSRTHIPNINRDTFIDIVSKLYDHYNIHDDKKKLERELNKMNNYMNNIDVLPNNTVSEHAFNKCKDTGCYLFLVKSTLLFDYIVHHNID